VGAATAVAGWDPAELSRIERALATHVGPMAKVMVREAARSCSDAGALASAVARHIPEDARRQQFMEAARAGSQVTPLAPATATASGATPIAQPGAAADPLAEDFKAQVLQVVTRRMGPIARVLVRRAADACGGSQSRFVQLLLQALPEADRWVVQGELNKLG
jgi:serine/threonine-protein kinase